MKTVILKNTEATTKNLQNKLFEYLKSDELFEDALQLLVEEEIIKDRIKQNYPGYKIDSRSWDSIENTVEINLVKE